MTLGKVVNPKGSVEMRCHGLIDLCLWNYNVKHYLAIVVLFCFVFGKHDRGAGGKFQVWNVGIICTSWGIRKEKKKKAVETLEK